MLFTYEMKIPVGQDKFISKEIDGELTIERDRMWSIALLCEDQNEFVSVFNKTDLYRDVCDFSAKKMTNEVQEAEHDAMRGYRWTDRTTERTA